MWRFMYQPDKGGDWVDPSPPLVGSAQSAWIEWELYKAANEITEYYAVQVYLCEPKEPS